jgi:hypothetical protein
MMAMTTNNSISVKAATRRFPEPEFIGSFDREHWTRIRTMNSLAEGGRVTSCAPSCALEEMLVGRVTFGFLRRLILRLLIRSFQKQLQTLRTRTECFGLAE